ncbi:hypothetical protein SAMN05216176_11013 [Nitratireductor indicus]|nr:hypothetical protein SAMN05216176_11013 [Nitratireductor indicus]
MLPPRSRLHQYNLSRAVCIDSTGSGCQSRLILLLFQGIATGCKEGVYCRRSVVVADGARFSDNTSVDVWAAPSSFVGVGGSTLDGSVPSLGRIVCSGGSIVAADGTTADGNPIDHVDVAGTGSSVKTINYPCGPGMVTTSAVANRASRAVTKSDVLKFERADRVSVPALSYSTIYEVVSGGASIVGGSFWG